MLGKIYVQTYRQLVTADENLIKIKNLFKMNKNFPLNWQRLRVWHTDTVTAGVIKMDILVYKARL